MWSFRVILVTKPFWQIVHWWGFWSSVEWWVKTWAWKAIRDGPQIMNKMVKKVSLLDDYTMKAIRTTFIFRWGKAETVIWMSFKKGYTVIGKVTCARSMLTLKWTCLTSFPQSWHTLKVCTDLMWLSRAISLLALKPQPSSEHSKFFVPCLYCMWYLKRYHYETENFFWEKSGSKKVRKQELQLPKIRSWGLRSQFVIFSVFLVSTCTSFRFLVLELSA